MTTDHDILLWIDTIQKDKRGIYPYHMAQKVALQWGIPITKAITLVCTHMGAAMDQVI